MVWIRLCILSNNYMKVHVMDWTHSCKISGQTVGSYKSKQKKTPFQFSYVSKIISVLWEIISYTSKTISTNMNRIYKPIFYQGPAIKFVPLAFFFTLWTLYNIVTDSSSYLEMLFVPIRFPCNYLFRPSREINHLCFVWGVDIYWFNVLVKVFREALLKYKIKWLEIKR